MKILLFQWKSYMDRGIERACKRLHIDFDTFFYEFTDWEKDDKFLELFIKRLKEYVYRCVISVNFSPLIAKACEERSVLYIAWVYDSPLHIRDLSALNYSCTKIYFFDRGQAEAFKKAGIRAEYLPLAVDTEIFQKAISKKHEAAAHCAEVSFVGKLYQTQYQYFTAPLSDYLKGYLEGIVGAQLKIYGGYLIPELVTEELLEKMNTEYAKAASDGFQMGKRELEFLLACEVTGRERYIALALLSEYFQVDLYSADQDPRLKQVRRQGYVDYYEEMPYVFSQSKINLNISLKTIQTGIPLRVIDIMGCGGFALSNYQEELTQYFVPGEECAVYENIEDLYAKVQFYLRHETERQRVMQHGFEKVKRDFTFDERIQKLLQDV